MYDNLQYKLNKKKLLEKEIYLGHITSINITSINM